MDSAEELEELEEEEEDEEDEDDEDDEEEEDEEEEEEDEEEEEEEEDDEEEEKDEELEGEPNQESRPPGLYVASCRCPALWNSTRHVCNRAIWFQRAREARGLSVKVGWPSRPVDSMASASMDRGPCPLGHRDRDGDSDSTLSLCSGVAVPDLTGDDTLVMGVVTKLEVFAFLGTLAAASLSVLCRAASSSSSDSEV